MTVQLPNTTLGVRRVDPEQVDAHGAPLPAQPGAATPLLPGKASEQPDGSWQLALDPSLWPVRVGDRVVGESGAEWLATSVKHIGTPALAPEEAALGLDLDVSFVRVEGRQVTPAGTEPDGAEFTGRVGSPV